MTSYRAIPGATKSASITTGTVVGLDDFSFDAGDLEQANAAIVSVVTETVMVTWSEVDPTATLGHPIAVEQILSIEGPAFRNLKLIAQSATATATVTLER